MMKAIANDRSNLLQELVIRSKNLNSHREFLQESSYRMKGRSKKQLGLDAERAHGAMMIVVQLGLIEYLDPALIPLKSAIRLARKYAEGK